MTDKNEYEEALKKLDGWAHVHREPRHGFESMIGVETIRRALKIAAALERGVLNEIQNIEPPSLYDEREKVVFKIGLAYASDFLGNKLKKEG